MEWLETAINKFDLAYADSNHHLLETHNFPALSPFFFLLLTKLSPNKCHSGQTSGHHLIQTLPFNMVDVKLSFPGMTGQKKGDTVGEERLPRKGHIF